MRSFGRIKSVVSGIPFANIMQMLSVALILFAAVMCYAFCSMDGKGKGYFHNDDLDRDTYYTYGQLDMETSDVQYLLYDQGSGITGGVLLTDTGVTEDGRKSIADMNEVKSIESSPQTMALIYFMIEMTRIFRMDCGRRRSSFLKIQKNSIMQTIDFISMPSDMAG